MGQRIPTKAVSNMASPARARRAGELMSECFRIVGVADTAGVPPCQVCRTDLS
jgi:hypothetical protein